ncbi:proteasome activating protein [Artemisia annua]|uniref:Proteasome activating protein n=1 Tax=Artemisia annua TaxID=35608 RepID=A0A2U1L4A9_ARTAN|nr:proteasome activating protein [Artemisia annua]
MHRYNAWLPPPVAEATKKEKESFKGVVNSVKESYNFDDPESVYGSLKWISVIDLFIKAKSEVSLDDVASLVEFGLQVFNASQDKLYAQVRWGNVLVRLLNKYQKKLTLKVEWRPFYDTMVQTHFTRNTGPEGWRIRQRHFEMVTSLVRSCRRFFPPGSANEIWSEFSSLLENPWHNSAFEGSGFVRLFLPTNAENEDFYSRNTGPEGWRIRQRHFEMVTSLVRSCRRFFPPGSANEIWSEFSSLLENPWHNSAFEGSGFVRLFLPTNAENEDFYSREWVNACIHQWDSIPNCQFWNSQWAAILARVIKNYKSKDWEALLPETFSRFLNMFEVPVASGGGSYPFTIDVPRNTRFLFTNRAHTPAKAIAKSIVYLLKPGSLAQQHFDKLVNLLEQYYHPSNGGRWTYSLERLLFHLVYTFQKRLQREKRIESCVGQKERESFVTTVLKLINRGQYSKNESLSDTVAAATSILSYVEPSLVLPFLVTWFHMALETMTATHQLKTAVTDISGFFWTIIMATLDDDMDTLAFMPAEQFSEWLDEFLCRLFSLLQHLEPSGVLNEDAHSPATSGTFLVEDGPQYFCMLEILFGRLSKSLYNQNILPAAIAEVGLLCCACIHANPELAINNLVEPLLSSVISSLKGVPLAGFGGSGNFSESSLSKARATHSPALETSIDYQLKVNIAGDQVLRSPLGSLVLYYPVDQYKSVSHHSSLTPLAEWISNKDFSNDEASTGPKWHIPNDDEIQLANELLNLHLESALDELVKICQDNIHSDPGNEKDQLKVTLLRIDSSLQGVLSCLPDFIPSFKNGNVENPPFLIAGATGSRVGSTALREKAASIIHLASEYLLEKKSDDSILLLLLIHIIEALRNYGSSEYEEWTNHRQAWKLESVAIIELPVNFIVSTHSKGKKRPRWALIDKAYMHNTWRTSQASYHLFRTSKNVSSSDSVNVLLDDLLRLCVHSYDTVRTLAGRSLVKMIKRWPSLIAKCVLTLTENLRGASSPEYAVLGSCAVLGTQTVIKHLALDPKSLFIPSWNSFEKRFPEIRGSIWTEFAALVSEISCMSFESTNLHWRYNLMANRVLLLLAMSSRIEPNLSSTILSEAAESPYKLPADGQSAASGDLQEKGKSSLEGTLTNIFQEQGFFSDTFDSLSNVHIISDTENSSSRGGHGNSSFQSLADKSITRFYFDFSSSWPRTPTWISLFGNDTFYSKFVNAKERSKQCVAAEAFAGLLHADVIGLSEAWDSWMMAQLQNILLAPSVESTPEWANCIRYAVLRYSFLSAALIEVSPQKMPDSESQLHYNSLHELLDKMSHPAAHVREAIAIALSVLCSNIRLHASFNKDYENGKNMVNGKHGISWDQVLQNRASELVVAIQNANPADNLENLSETNMTSGSDSNSSDDVQWMETLFHFVISLMKSGRSAFLVDVLVGFLYPVISLQETSNKDLSILAKAAFELLKWRIFPDTHLRKAVSILLLSADDPNWRTRSATLTFLRSFMYRHTFILSNDEKQKIWKTVEKLLTDNQVREHAAAVLAGLMKGEDGELSKDFRERAYSEAMKLQKRRNKGWSHLFLYLFTLVIYLSVLVITFLNLFRNATGGPSIASIHGRVLALAACVLSVPYDMPSWLPEHATLLARFVGEPSPVKSTVTKAVAEFCRTHADTWSVQKDSFTEEQLEVLADTSASSSYFA